MKRNLHNLMFNTGMDQKLINIEETESDVNNANNRNNEY
jgi:hypothetical protein